jgi:hypothetical protein
MDYKDKYLKYKSKYLNQRYIATPPVISTIPANIPNTQSWIYMPLLLAPFKNVIVTFDKIIDSILLKYKDNFSYFSTIQYYQLSDYVNIIERYYTQTGINLDNNHNLTNFGYIYDNYPFHLQDNYQEELLNKIGIKNNIDLIIQILFSSDINKKIIGKKIIMELYMDPIKFEKNYDDNFHGNVINRQINITSSNSTQIIKNKEIIKNFILQNHIDVYLRPVDDPLWEIKDQALIVFGGWGDRQYNLYTILKNYKGYVIYFSDKYNEWYSGLISPFISFIREYAVSINKYIFLGWSMGGYGALHASVFFPEKECICISMVPQTINYKNYNNKIIIKQDVDYSNDKNDKNPLVQSIELMYKDIPTILRENINYTTKIYTLVGKSECNDYNEFHTPLYLDTLHVGAIINYPNVSSIIYNVASHRLLEKINFISLLQTIENNFHNLYNNQNEGNKILRDSVNIR